MGQNIEYILLGYSDEGHENVFTGVDGTDFLALWGKGQPDNCCSGQNCMAMGVEDGNYALGDFSCSITTSGYICEVLG